MDVWNILSVGASTVVLFALIHVAVFYVVKSLYPPTVRAPPAPAPVLVPLPPQAPVLSEAPPQAPEIPLVTTKLPPPVDTRDPGPARPAAQTFSEPPQEIKTQSANVPTYESLLSAVTAGKEGQSNLGPMSGIST
jgi:hypothetical protein